MKSFDFDLDAEERSALLKELVARLEAYYQNTSTFSTSPELNIQEIRSFISNPNLANGLSKIEALEKVTAGLEKYAVHTPHPKYFGLYNPRANYAGILADFITATYNPQMAAWSHAPFAAEVEQYVIHEFGKRFGFRDDSIDGVFCTGGAEANLSAILCALNNRYEIFADEGVLGLKKRPVIFCSEEAHHSIHKAARVAGLGSASVVDVPVNEALTMNQEALKRLINERKLSNEDPAILVATGGTTGQGVIDDLKTLSDIAKEHEMWFHVDAAFGGGSILSDRHQHLLAGIEKADSITFDAHKWMSLPMGTSMLITSSKEILSKTFRIATAYMPKDAGELTINDPFAHSIQWSRRFNGLKVYLALLFYGWEGYQNAIDHHMKMGQKLNSLLKESGWSILNPTPLPVTCFTDSALKKDIDFVPTVLRNILAKKASWISQYPVNGINCFRACITNYNTQEEDLRALVDELNLERQRYKTECI